MIHEFLLLSFQTTKKDKQYVSSSDDFAGDVEEAIDANDNGESPVPLNDEDRSDAVIPAYNVFLQTVSEDDHQFHKDSDSVAASEVVGFDDVRGVSLDNMNLTNFFKSTENRGDEFSSG